jgi:hypothetical protein
MLTDISRISPLTSYLPTHPRMKLTKTGPLDVNATGSGTNGVDISETTYPSGTSQKLSTKSRVRSTLPRSNASCLSQR